MGALLNGTTQMADTTAAPERKKRVRKAGVTYDLATGAFKAVSYEPDGETIHGELSGNMSDFPADIQKQFALHGITQKLTDESRMGETPKDRLDMLVARLESLKNGKWGETLGDPATARLINALGEYCKRNGKSFDEAAWRERLKADKSLGQRVLLEKPEVYSVYRELYGDISAESQAALDDL